MNAHGALAVMDAEVARLERAWREIAGPHDTGPEPPTLQAAREARAAVAELVEAAQFARETGGMGLGYTPGVDRRLAAALARVQGGAA